MLTIILIHLLIIFLCLFLLFLPINLIKRKRRSNKNKNIEFIGKLTKEDLHSIERKHKILNNLYIPTFKNFTTEIDLIYIDNTGIYIIKPIKFEDCNEYKQIEQTFYDLSKLNDNHIKHLQNLLPGVPNKVFRSVIVLTNKLGLSKVYVKSIESNFYVVTLPILSNFINYHKKPKLSDDEIDRIYNILKPYAIMKIELNKTI